MGAALGFEGLRPQDRKALLRLAEETGAAADRIAAEMIGAYLQLLRDAPAATGPRPLSPIIKRALGAPKIKKGSSHEA